MAAILKHGKNLIHAAIPAPILFMNDFWKSRSIADRYEFVEALGKGGIGTVVLARDKTLDKLVAIKILNSNLSNEESIRFQQEGILSGRLKHENIVSVLDFGITDTNVPYLIMEHLQGTSLADIVTRDGAFATLFAVQICQQICRGMISSHKQGVVHRDLKPANVIMARLEDDSLSAKIIDFGLARIADQNSRLTSTGTAIGSPLFMSPEQGQGQAGDERSDIYSMGCLMYQLLTATTPFAGDSAMLTVMMHQSAKPDTLSTRAKREFPPLLEEIVARCLRKTPEERYQSFSELLGDLEKLEAEMLHAEREEALAARERSGLQRVLSTVTDFSTPFAASVSGNYIRSRTLLILALLIAAGFGIYLFLPALINTTFEDEVPRKEAAVVEFEDTLNTFSTLKPQIVHGRVILESGKQAVDQDLAQLGKIRRFDLLDLTGSSCDGTGLGALSNTTIIKLKMDSCPVNAEGMYEIGRVKGLESLELKDCDELQDNYFARLAGNKTLKELSFSGVSLTENAFEYLAELPELQRLGLDEYHVTQKGMAMILTIPRLDSLTFEECEIDAGAFAQLQNFRTRQFVNIGFWDMPVTPPMVAHLKRVSTKQITLRKLEVSPSVLAQIRKDARYQYQDVKVVIRP